MWGKRFSEAIGDTPDVNDTWAQHVKMELDEWARTNNKKHPYTVAQGIDLAKKYRRSRAELAAETSRPLKKALTEGLSDDELAELEKDLRERYELDRED